MSDIIQTPEHIVPFTISTSDLETIVYNHLAQNNVPDDIFSDLRFIQKECFYVPAYDFDVDYQVDWSVTFGFEKIEEYTDFREEHGKSVRYKAKRKIIDWKPERGRSHGEMDAAIYAGDQFKNEGTNPLTIVPYVIAHGKRDDFDKEKYHSIEVEPYTITEDQAFSLLDKDVADHMTACVQSNAQGERQKDWKWVLSNLRTVAHRVYIPIASVLFEYQGKQYQFYCDGVNGGKIVCDELPLNTENQKAIKRGYTPLYIAILGGLVHLFLGRGDGIVYLAIGVLVALAYSFLRRFSIGAYSAKLKEVAKEALQKKEVASFPKRGFLATFQKDALILPLVMLISLAVMFIPSYTSGQFKNKEEIQVSDLMPKARVQTLPRLIKQYEVAHLMTMLEASHNKNWSMVAQEVSRVKKAISKEPSKIATKEIEFLHQEGIRFLRQNRIQSAIESFYKVLEKDPSQIDAKINLALAYKMNLDLTKADEYLVDVLTKEPDRAVAWGHLAEIYAKSSASQNEEKEVFKRDAIAALRLSVYFSADRKKVTHYLAIASRMDDSIDFKEVVQLVLDEIDSIPQSS